jgi:hypothetical protein
MVLFTFARYIPIEPTNLRLFALSVFPKYLFLQTTSVDAYHLIRISFAYYIICLHTLLQYLY